MKRRGFTLIELLAVIVILAVIALITTIVIIKVVENSRKNAAKNSALNYLDSVEKYIMYHDVDDAKYPEEIESNSLYQISNKEYTVPEGKTAVENKNLNEILGNTVKGEKPDTGIVEFDEKRKVVSAIMVVNNYNVTCTSSTSCTVEGKNTDPIPVLTIDEDNIKVTETKITIPYTVEIEKGSVTVECVYGTDENYGQTGIINEENNTCTLSNLTTGTKYYFKLIPTSDKNKKGKSQTSSKTTLNYISSTEFKVGDYIKMTPSYEGIYTPTTDSSSPYYTGTDTPGSITPSELDTWVVIRKNDDGTIDMVSLNVSSTEITFYGQVGYKNLVGALNKIAEQYENSKFTSDSRHIGYLPGTSIEQCSDMCSFDILYETDLNLVENSLKTLVATNNSKTISNYFVASRYVYSWTKPDYGVYYSPQHVNTSGTYATSTSGTTGDSRSVISFLYTTSGGSWRNSSAAIRPIVTLKSNVVASSSGDGSSEHPWVLVEQ